MSSLRDIMRILVSIPLMLLLMSVFSSCSSTTGADHAIPTSKASIESTTYSVDQITNELASGAVPLSFPQMEFKIDVGNATATFFGVKNIEKVVSRFCVIIDITSPGITSESLFPAFILNDTMLRLNSSQSIIIPLTNNAAHALKNRYKATMTIVEVGPVLTSNDCSLYKPVFLGQSFDISTLLAGDSIYAHKSFSIVVQ